MSTNKNEFDSSMLQELIDFIKTNYLPASKAEATIAKSTMEIYQELQDIFPSIEYGPYDVYLMLKKAGYQIGTPENDLQFKWLMKASS